MKAKNLQLSAGVLRIILAVSLFLVMAGAIAGFVFAHQKLTGYAVDISKKKVDAEASKTVIQSLEAISKQLEDNSDVRETAGSLRLDDSHPEFGVSRELRSIAARNNIKISLTTTSPTTDGTTPPPATTPSPAPSQPTPPVASTGIFSITMAVRPERGEVFDEASFRDFLQFLRDLEQNLPKVKVNGVRLSGGVSESADSSGASDSNGISVEPISLEVYIKK